MFSDNGGPSDRDRLHEAYKEIRRLQEALAAAQAPPASDPPGLVAAVKELQDAYRECDYRDRVITQAACARADSAMAFVLAYDLTAPAQMPTKGGE